MPPQENRPNQDQFSQVVESLRSANNVLVTVKSDPSVDQLAACIGLTLALNKEGKHASAVFSGAVPSTISFLEPEKTLEKNTDSMRDFIISLDKNKADKLRYKVDDENNLVKIFITPYKTSISEEDLDFSQGDFNVDAVVALGVHDRNELDQAILAHGRILHDATVTSVNIVAGPELGSINWVDAGSSSLCEMVSDLIGALDGNLLDSQIATALLTGVVAETDRFRNEKSSPHTMSVSGTLMAAGASTQLVATKLEEPPEPSDEIPEVIDDQEGQERDGTIEIEHDDDDIHIDDTGKLRQVADILQDEEQPQVDTTEVDGLASVAQTPDGPDSGGDAPTSSMVLEPPALGGQLTANSVPEHQQYSDSTDPLSANNTSGPTLNHQQADDGAGDRTLSEIEQSLNSPHLTEDNQSASQDAATFTPPVADVPPPPEPDYARDAVQRAVEASTTYTEPSASIGSQPVNLDLSHDAKQSNPSGVGDPNTPPPPVPPPLPQV